MRELGELAQDLYQVLKTNLGGSTGAMGKLGEAYFAALHGNLLWGIVGIVGIAWLYQPGAVIIFESDGKRIGHITPAGIRYIMQGIISQ